MVVQMDFLEIMNSYFRSEKIAALCLILPAGLVMLACAYLLWRGESRTFALGGIIPLIVFGLILAGIGAGVGFGSSSKAATIERQYAEAPGIVAKSELQRMEKVIRNFHTTLLVYGFLALIGLGAYYFVPWDFAKSAGFVLIIASGLGLAIDSTAERRAEPYLAALNEIAKRN